MADPVISALLAWLLLIQRASPKAKCRHEASLLQMRWPGWDVMAVPAAMLEQQAWAVL